MGCASSTNASDPSGEEDEGFFGRLRFNKLTGQAEEGDGDEKGDEDDFFQEMDAGEGE